MFLVLEDTSDVRAGIDQPGHCLFINYFQTNPPAWMMENGARRYYVVSSLLLPAALTGCCGSHTLCTMSNGMNQHQCRGD